MFGLLTIQVEVDILTVGNLKFDKPTERIFCHYFFGGLYRRDSPFAGFPRTLQLRAADL
jgi:hypothetical protein